MKKFTVLMPSWKVPELLKVSIPSILDSFSEDSKLIVILNEADLESIEICLSYNLEFICLSDNRGPLAIDYAIPLIDAEYVANVNTDMLFIKGWDSEMIEIIENNHPCSASCFYVEPVDGGNPIVIPDNIGLFTDPNTRTIFENNYKNGKYKRKARMISTQHPIVVKTSDFIAVNGYSNFDLDWFPGYSLDYFFPWKLWQHYGGNFKFIMSDTFCIYHGMSMNIKKLSPQILARNGWDKFLRETGITVERFKREINCFSEI